MDLAHQLGPAVECRPADDRPGSGAHELFHEFMGVMRIQRLLLHRAFAREEMFPAQALCLRVLCAAGGELAQSELADALVLTRPTVTRVLQRMERSGLIRRRPDQADQRHTRVEVTQDGRELQRRLDGVMAEYVEATLGRLDQNDREELARILRRWRALNDEVLAAPRDQHPVPDPETRGSVR
jgi:DNA-binding MarR family transcriptional regulator